MSEDRRSPTPHLLGIVSDTHGLVRPELAKAFEDVEMIIHAGDIGKPDVLDSLQRIAPVIAVRGNMDRGEWARGLPEAKVIEVESVLLYVRHDLGGLDLDPVAAGFRAVISGHSHRPAVRKRKGVLYVNPGSVGPHRFTYPVSLALLHIHGNALEAQLIKLKPGSKADCELSVTTCSCRGEK